MRSAYSQQGQINEKGRGARWQTGRTEQRRSAPRVDPRDSKASFLASPSDPAAARAMPKRGPRRNVKNAEFATTPKRKPRFSRPEPPRKSARSTPEPLQNGPSDAEARRRRSEAARARPKRPPSRPARLRSELRSVTERRRSRPSDAETRPAALRGRLFGVPRRRREPQRRKRGHRNTSHTKTLIFGGYHDFSWIY